MDFVRRCLVRCNPPSALGIPACPVFFCNFSVIVAHGDRHLLFGGLNLDSSIFGVRGFLGDRFCGSGGTGYRRQKRPDIAVPLNMPSWVLVTLSRFAPKTPAVRFD